STTGFNQRNGLVQFSGTASTQTIATAGGEDFHNWRIVKSALQPLVLMNSEVRVANALELNTAAILDLNANRLVITNPAPTAIATSTTFGTLRHIRSERTDNASRVRWDIGTTTGAHLVPFGTATAYIPFTFNLLSGDAGQVTMATYGTPPDNMPLPVTPTTVYALPSGYGLMPDNAEATVDRFWQVDVTGAPLAHLTFTYMASELPSAPLNDPVMYRAQRYNSAVPYWEVQLPATATGAYFCTADNVSAFGPFALSHLWSPLPVELLRFDATADGQAVRLEWQTASELNNDYFQVLRSRDGVEYAPVAMVPGAGTRNAPQDYVAFDREPFPGVGFYKLRQVDVDGSWTESPVRVVRFDGMARAVLYPNPVRGTAFLAGLPDGPVDLRLEDAAGRVVAAARKTSEGDRFAWPLQQLPPGSYILTLTGAQGASCLRMVLE
ncbi:MAG: T9SS type A sorting domain-containing protein, partial [Flavobacteriales bacterium]